MISDVIKYKDSRVRYYWTVSADNEDSVCDYASAPTKIQEDVKDQVIVPADQQHVQTGEGYKGIASQPDPAKLRI